MAKSYWLINSNRSEVKRFMKNDKSIDGVFEYMFIDTGKIVPNGYEEQWTEQVKDADELRGLFAIMMSWSPDGWLVEDVKKKETDQMSLF